MWKKKEEVRVKRNMWQKKRHGNEANESWQMSHGNINKIVAIMAMKTDLEQMR